MNTIIKFAFFLVFLLFGIAITAFYWTFWKPLPNYEQTSEHMYLIDAVSIYWDDFGVPHIYAMESWSYF